MAISQVLRSAFGLATPLAAQAAGPETAARTTPDIGRAVESIRNELRRLRALMPGKRPKWVVVDLSGTYPARARRRPIFGLPLPAGVIPHETSLEELESDLEAIARAPFVEGVVFRVHPLRTSHATAYALRSGISRLRAAGKRTLALVSQIDWLTFYVASAAERVVAPESADVMLHGIALGTVFMREALARAGVRFEKVAIGEFKNAFDELVRDSMSEPQREQLSALLDAMYRHVTGEIASSRGLGADAVRAAVDEGVTSARRARELGLLDRVAYEDEEIKRGFESLDAARRVLAPPSAAGRRRIAIVSLLGGILPGKSRRSPLPLPMANFSGAETIVAALRAAARDDATAAVVLYIDSGGGSALASDLIAREVARVRAKKPVVAVMGGIAASGGYYVACPATRVLCAPTTITGSIGVLTGKLVLEDLTKKIGAKAELVSRGRYALLTRPFKGLDDEERALLEKSSREIYERFVARVAEGRRMDASRVNEIGRGRVWSGKDAVDIGLADELGDLRTGIQRACEIANVKVGSATYNVEAPHETLLPTADDPTTLARAIGDLGRGGVWLLWEGWLAVA